MDIWTSVELADPPEMSETFPTSPQSLSPDRSSSELQLRVVYVTEAAGCLWVIHAFRKKSGIRTPKAEIDLIGSRLARLRRELSS